MNRLDLITAMAERLNITEQATTNTLTAFEDVITDALIKGEKVQLVGFGSFETKNRAARKGHNPHTGEEIMISACKSPTFNPSKALKEIVNK